MHLCMGLSFVKFSQVVTGQTKDHERQLVRVKVMYRCNAQAQAVQQSVAVALSLSCIYGENSRTIIQNQHS